VFKVLLIIFLNSIWQ